MIDRGLFRVGLGEVKSSETEWPKQAGYGNDARMPGANHALSQ